ncbi:MAG: hypothetical protein NVSMB25_07330 [Thermoleophilaceae bacterium]
MSPPIRLAATLLTLVACLTVSSQAGASRLAWQRSVRSERSPAGAPRTQTTFALLRSARLHGSHRGVRELTPALGELALRLKTLSGAQRRAAASLLARPTDGAADPQQNGWTVPEASGSPYCSADFCVHWASSGRDAPDPRSSDGSGVPDYVRTVSAVAENVHNVENVGLGWRLPKGDGTLGGGLDKVDIYLKNLAGTGIYGYTSPDPGQLTQQGKSNQLYAYLVMDNSFTSDKFPRYQNPIVPLQVTLAHEYNHVLQFNYDALEDTWMFESTAVWMEGKVYPEAHDYFQYLPGWVSLTPVPLTTFNGTNPNDRSNVKVYGSSVWNKWIDARYGQEAVRGAWEASTTATPASFAPAAYDISLRRHGGSGFFDAFSRFAVATAEWQASNSGFPEGPAYPDVQRVGTLSVGGAGGRARLDHTTFALVDVPRGPAPRVKLVVNAPAGTAGAIALVGRNATGTQSTQLAELPHGGSGAVAIDGASSFSRLTAVLVNADVTQNGYSRSAGDWQYLKNAQPFAARLTTDFTPPRARRRAPAPGARNVRARAVSITFTKPVVGISSHTIVLVASNGHRVRARVRVRSGSRVATLTPLAGLRRGTRYQVRLVSSITDKDLNPLPRTAWSFTTAR